MNKKITINILIIFLVVAISFGAGVLIKKFKANSETVGIFKLELCSYYLENCAPDLNKYGAVKTPDDAKKAANQYFKSEFGKANMPCMVSYDEYNKAWFVENITPPTQKGGGYNIIIRADDGEVLALWPEK